MCYTPYIYVIREKDYNYKLVSEHFRLKFFMRIEENEERFVPNNGNEV